MIADEAEVGFVHERGGLECVPAAFLREELLRDCAELIVDEREELIGGFAVALLGALNEKGDGVAGASGHGEESEKMTCGDREGRMSWRRRCI